MTTSYILETSARNFRRPGRRAISACLPSCVTGGYLHFLVDQQVVQVQHERLAAGHARQQDLAAEDFLARRADHVVGAGLEEAVERARVVVEVLVVDCGQRRVQVS